MKETNNKMDEIIPELLFIRLIKHRGIDIKEIFEKQDLYPLGIYGLGNIGRPFADWMIESGVDVEFCYDRNTDIELGTIEVRHSMDEIEGARTIIVTSEIIYNDMKKNIDKFNGVRLIRIRDLLENILLMPEEL